MFGHEQNQQDFGNIPLAKAEGWQVMVLYRSLNPETTKRLREKGSSLAGSLSRKICEAAGSRDIEQVRIRVEDDTDSWRFNLRLKAFDRQDATVRGIGSVYDALDTQE